jgi:hypothetical protein
MIGVQKWTTTKGAPSLVFCCNFLLNDQSGRPASGRNPELAHISRRFPAWRPLPFGKTIVLVLRSRFSCESNQIQGHGGVNSVPIEDRLGCPGSDGLGL